MTTEVLKQKTTRYLRGESVPAETRQIQAWLSCTGKQDSVSIQEKELIRNEIVADIHAYLVYTQVIEPRPKYWWQKITALF